MTCQEFLARHAEYMDDLVSPDRGRWEAHMTACASCARYDRVVRQGVRIVRGFPEIEPSLDFFPRLQHRLYNLEDELRASARGPGTSAMVSLAIAGVLALLAWSPLLRLDQKLIPMGGASGAWTASEGVPTVAGRGDAAVEARGGIAESPARPDRGLPSIGEPNTLRQARLLTDGWGTAPRLIIDEVPGRWTSTEILDEFIHSLERAPEQAANGPVWWWSGTRFTEPTLLRHYPGAAVAPPLPKPYPSQLTGAQSAQPTSDTVRPRN